MFLKQDNDKQVFEILLKLENDVTLYFLSHNEQWNVKQLSTTDLSQLKQMIQIFYKFNF